MQSLDNQRPFLRQTLPSESHEVNRANLWLCPAGGELSRVWVRGGVEGKVAKMEGAPLRRRRFDLAQECQILYIYSDHRDLHRERHWSRWNMQFILTKNTIAIYSTVGLCVGSWFGLDLFTLYQSLLQNWWWFKCLAHHCYQVLRYR